MSNDNPLLQPENYYEGYNDSIKQNSTQSESIELDKLCFHVFGMSEDGLKLMQILKDRFIYCSTPCSLNANFETSAVYYEGYREAFRQLIAAVENYKMRMEYEAKANQAKEGA